MADTGEERAASLVVLLALIIQGRVEVVVRLVLPMGVVLGVDPKRNSKYKSNIQISRVITSRWLLKEGMVLYYAIFQS